MADKLINYIENQQLQAVTMQFKISFEHGCCVYLNQNTKLLESIPEVKEFPLKISNKIKAAEDPNFWGTLEFTMVKGDIVRYGESKTIQGERNIRSFLEAVENAGM